MTSNHEDWSEAEYFRTEVEPIMNKLYDLCTTNGHNLPLCTIVEYASTDNGVQAMIMGNVDDRAGVMLKSIARVVNRYNPSELGAEDVLMPISLEEVLAHFMAAGVMPTAKPAD